MLFLSIFFWLNFSWFEISLPEIILYILSMNLRCPSIFAVPHHHGNKILSHQRRTLLGEEITQALNQMQVEQEGLVLLYCLII